LADAMAKSTLPATVTQPKATLQPTLDSGMPARTAVPVMTSAKPPTTQSGAGAVHVNVAPSTDPNEPHQDPYNIVSATSRSTSSKVEDAPQSVPSQTIVDSSPGLSEAAGAIFSILLTQGHPASAGASARALPSSVDGVL
jgi:hypothetical protein